MARTPEEEQRRRRRKRLIQGLIVGGAAIGLPALANTLVRRRAGQLAPARWGRARQFAWRHGKISFQRLGDGEPIVLLHSFGPGHSSEQWRRSGEMLAGERLVFAPDLLGWGHSEKPSIAYDGELYVRLLHDLLTDVVGKRAVVVAAGLSAAYAVQVAVDHPELVRALALVVPQGIEPHGDEPDFKDAVVHRLLRLPVLGTSALNVYTSRSGIAHHLRNEIYASPERVDAALLDRHYRAAHQAGAHAPLAAYLAGYLNHGVDALLPRLTVPTWIAWGRHACCPAVETADLWLARVTAQLSVLEESGALPHVEEPAAFCRELESFLAESED